MTRYGKGAFVGCVLICPVMINYFKLCTRFILDKHCSPCLQEIYWKFWIRGNKNLVLTETRPTPTLLLILQQEILTRLKTEILDVAMFSVNEKDMFSVESMIFLRGRHLPKWVLTYYFANFLTKTAWKWKDLDPGGAHPWCPLDPPMMLLLKCCACVLDPPLIVFPYLPSCQDELTIFTETFCTSRSRR